MSFYKAFLKKNCKGSIQYKYWQYLCQILISIKKIILMILKISYSENDQQLIMQLMLLSWLYFLRRWTSGHMLQSVCSIETVFYVTLISGKLLNLVQKLHNLATLWSLCHHDNEDKRLRILYFHTDQVSKPFYHHNLSYHSFC